MKRQLASRGLGEGGVNRGSMEGFREQKSSVWCREAQHLSRCFTACPVQREHPNIKDAPWEVAGAQHYSSWYEMLMVRNVWKVQGSLGIFHSICLWT